MKIWIYAAFVVTMTLALAYFGTKTVHAKDRLEATKYFIRLIATGVIVICAALILNGVM